MKKKLFILLLLCWSCSIIVFGQPTTPNWPVNPDHLRGCVTGNIGEYRSNHYHVGVDIVSQNGTINVYAISTGTYSFHYASNCWDQYIQVGNIKYFHLQELNYPPSGTVQAGTLIGTFYTVGGCSPHVHVASVNNDVNFLNNQLYGYVDNVAPIIVDHCFYRNRNNNDEGNTISQVNPILYNDIITLNSVLYTKVFGKVDIIMNAYDPGVGSTGYNVVVNNVIKDNRMAPSVLFYDIRNLSNASIERVENINFTIPMSNPYISSRNYIYAHGTVCPATPSILIFNITSHPSINFDRYWNTRKRINTADDWNLDPNFDARCVEEAKFKDGKYKVVIGASDMDNTGNPHNTTTHDIDVIIDNFKPYIKKVEIAPNPINSSAYIAEWQWNSALGQLEFTQNTSFYAASPNWPLSVKVTTSEPLKALSLQIEGVNVPYGYTVISPTECLFTINSSNLLQFNNGGVKSLIFEGYDLADNQLMNINSTLPIPASSINHRQDNGNWMFNYKTTNQDNIHKIKVTDVLSLNASINATSSTGNTPLSVAFSSNVSGGTPPYTYVWNFGDNKPLSTISDPIHVFDYNNGGANPNTYTVALKVTDANGIISVVYKTITVYPTGTTPSITANFDYAVTYLSPTNFQLALFNQSQIPNLSGIQTRWYYDYSNDQTNYGTSNIYTYTTQGTRRIRLEIIDVNNNTILGYKEKDVNISLPANGYVTDFTWTGSPGPALVNNFCVLHPIFWGYTGFPTSYVWTITDPSGNPPVSYIDNSFGNYNYYFNTTGVYTVRLEIYDDNSSNPLIGTVTKNINVTSVMVVPTAANQVVTTTPLLINQFGYDVDLTDDYAVIGDYIGGVYPGNASVYKIDNDVFSFMCQLTGGRVAINRSGNTIVTGGGSVVSIYTRNGSQWNLAQQLTGFYMPSVDIYGDYIIIGSLFNGVEGEGNGFVQIYKKATNGVWYYLQTINSQDNAYPYDDDFGTDVKISKSHIIISNGSTAWFYEQQSNGLWNTTPVKNGIAPIDIYEDRAITATSTHYFCDGVWNNEYQPVISQPGNINYIFSVSINANFALFGYGPTITGTGGKVKVFQRYSNTQFYEREILECPNSTADDRFGRACALSESHILIGAHNWNNEGAAYHYLNYISPCEKIMNISNYYPDPNNYGTRYALQIKIDNSNYNQGVNIIYKAKDIILKSGFKASLGSNVLLSFLECNKTIFSPCVNGKSIEDDLINDKENLIETEDVFLWPNPTNNIVNLKTKEPNAIIEQYELYNSLGIKIEDKKVIGKNEITVDLSKYPSGILILRVIVNSNTHFFKIIKQ